MISLKILALIFSVLIIFKLLFLVFNPEDWIKKSKTLIDKRLLITWIPLTVLVGYFVFQNIAIYKVAAVMFFTAMLMAITFFSSEKLMIEMRKKIKKVGVKTFWFPILIWAGVAITVIIDLILQK